MSRVKSPLLATYSDAGASRSTAVNLETCLRVWGDSVTSKMFFDLQQAIQYNYERIYELYSKTEYKHTMFFYRRHIDLGVSRSQFYKRC